MNVRDRLPYSNGTFWDFLTVERVHPWLSDIAAMSLSDGRGLSPTICGKISEAFSEYIGGEGDPDILSEVIASQDYQVIREEDHLDVPLSGTVCHIYIGNRPEAADRDGRTLVLGGDVIEKKDGMEFYPLFAAGMFTRLDPERKDDLRQKRIEYSWLDFSIPGR